MIDFRYHLVSIIAVFLALALGLFLGSTTLQGTVATSLSNQAAKVRGENQTLEQQLSTNRSQLGQQQAFAQAVEPSAVADKLTGRTVTVVAAPGVSGSDRSALETALLDSGASIGSDISLSSSYLDPTQAAELGQLAAELSGSRSLPAGSGAVKADALLASLLLVRPGHTASPARLATALTAFADGKLLSVNKPPVAATGTTSSPTTGPQPAGIAVLETPAPSATATAQTLLAQSDALLELAHQLRAAGMAAVVAGPTPNGVNGGVLQAATSSDDAGLVTGLSLVDSTDTAAGRIAAVYALAAGLVGQTGVYGPSQSVPLPTGSPTPTP